MTEGLTDRQRELFQEDKRLLIHIITNLEEELEIERKCRVKAEQAHIKAQIEIDEVSKDNSSSLDSDEFRHKLDTKIRKYYDSIKKCEEGENGVL